MSSSTPKPDPFLPEQPASAPAAESQGSILQRGGEELEIEKVSDRFTVRPTSKSALPELAEQMTARGLHLANTIPTAHSAELVVNPAERDQAMQELRNQAGIDFASHVYQFKQNPGTRVYLTNQLTIQFAAQVPTETIAEIAAATGLQQLQSIADIPNTFVFQLTSEATENPIKLANRLMQRPEVLVAEPNILIKAQSYYSPREPLYRNQWYLHHQGGRDLAAGSHIAAESAWDLTRGSRAVIVAVIDDSFDLNHPDFQGRGKIVAPRDFKDQDFLPIPNTAEPSHGTACAAIAIAEENGVGMVGVAPGCAFMPIRSSGFLDDAAIEQLFNWAVEQGADVISCSWGPSAVYFPLSLRQRAALTRAATTGRHGKGCVIVFAAGNANRPIQGTINERNWSKGVLQGTTKWLSGFAAHPDVITVAACTSLNKKAAYSNWGTHISVCAPSNNAAPGIWLDATGFISTAPEVTAILPGQQVLTADLRGSVGYDQSDYTATFGGTSSACPMVAGVAALMLSVNPNLSAQQVRQILQQTADKIVDSSPDLQLGLRKGTYEANGHSDWFGYGKVNAFKAVQAAQKQVVVPLTATQQIQGQNQTSIPIPDYEPKGVTSSIQISDASPVRDLQVNVTIEHSFMGDLEISLIAPMGQKILLQGRTLGRQVNLQATYSLQTTPLLQQLLHQSANGSWHLQVVDHALMNVGTLKRWQLTVGV